MRLHRIPFSTNVERVLLALDFKGLTAEDVWVDPDDRAALVALSGQDLVPVLEDGPLVIADSTAIIEHLEATHPEPALYPARPAGRAEVEIFIDWFNRVWKTAPNAIAAELERADPDEGAIEAHAAAMRRHLGWFEGLLDGRDHLFGAFGAGDCIAHPFLRYAAGRPPQDDELFHRVLETHQPLGADHPRLAAWIARVAARGTS